MKNMGWEQAKIDEAKNGYDFWISLPNEDLRLSKATSLNDMSCWNILKARPDFKLISEIHDRFCCIPSR